MFKTPKLLPTGVELSVTNKKNSTMRKATYTWKLNNALLNDNSVKEEKRN